MKLTGKVALVTGANRGIGFEVCRQLGAEGATILLGVRRQGEETLQALSRQGYPGEIVYMDLSNSASILDALGKFSKEVDILINNAAILDRGDLFSVSGKEIEAVVKTNLLGPMLLTRQLADDMRKRRWGRIVNVSSGMGAVSRGLGSESVAYRITKLALNGLTICLAADLRNSGVLINSVDPGWVRTSMGGDMAQRTPPEGARSIVNAVLLPDNGPSGFFFRDGRRVDW
jgi:NAD(P)-dependent dehydrogenase (short-subunit alcohol dehydrogenase family)